jgi:hypothetical protein
VFANFGDSKYDKIISFAIHTYEYKPDPISYSFSEDGERTIAYDPKDE